MMSNDLCAAIYTYWSKNYVTLTIDARITIRIPPLLRNRHCTKTQYFSLNINWLKQLLSVSRAVQTDIITHISNVHIVLCCARYSYRERDTAREKGRLPNTRSASNCNNKTYVAVYACRIIVICLSKVAYILASCYTIEPTEQTLFIRV